MFKNPIRSMPKLTEPRGRVRYLSNVERTALLEACKQSYWKGLYLVVSIALSTGARRSEIMNLKWNDIVDGRAVLEKTKNGERRTLPFIQSVQDQLKEWGKVRRLDTDLLFPSDNDPKRPRNFTSAWKTATKKSKVGRLSFP